LRVDVRDRAVFYYRLLKYDVAKAEKVVNCPKISVNSFIDPAEKELTDKIFNEFNTLSVIYKKPSELFINDEPIEMSSDDEDADDSDADEDAEADTDQEVEDDDDEGDGDEADEEVMDQQQAEVVNGGGMGGFDDILGMGGDVGMQQPQQSAEEDMAASVNLIAQPQCTKKVFQKLWKGTKDRVMTETRQLASEEESRNSFEALANGANFKTMASAPKGRKLKFYFYAQEAESECLHFVECNINLDALRLDATFKGTSDSFEDVAALFLHSIGSILAQ